MAWAVSRRSQTAEVRNQCQACACRISGRQRGFHRSASFHQFSILIYSSITDDSVVRVTRKNYTPTKMMWWSCDEKRNYSFNRMRCYTTSALCLLARNFSSLKVKVTTGLCRDMPNNAQCLFRATISTYPPRKIFNNSQVPAVWKFLNLWTMTPKQVETMREVSWIILCKAAEFMKAFRLLDELIVCAEIK
jgi:hypothetical protein